MVPETFDIGSFQIQHPAGLETPKHPTKNSYRIMYMLDDVAAQLQLEQVPAQTVIVREGEPGDRLYIVHSGEVEVVGRDPHGHEVTVATQGKATSSTREPGVGRGRYRNCWSSSLRNEASSQAAGIPNWLAGIRHVPYRQFV